jgi:hypothetical protein
MKKSRFSPRQIAGILKEFELGKSVEELSMEHGISKSNSSANLAFSNPTLTAPKQQRVSDCSF